VLVARCTQSAASSPAGAQSVTALLRRFAVPTRSVLTGGGVMAAKDHDRQAAMWLLEVAYLTWALKPGPV